MKKAIMMLAVAAVMLSGCKKEPFRLSPDATLSIRPAAGVKLKAETENPEHLSALEIVKQTVNMKFQSFDKSAGEGKHTFYRGFSDAQRELNPETPRLKMWGTDVIDFEGNLCEHFIIAEDVVLERAVRPGDMGSPMDTIGYIPNATLRAAEREIRAAYANKDIERVYKLFDEAYRFTPITAAEWKALKAQGLQ